MAKIAIGQIWRAHRSLAGLKLATMIYNKPLYTSTSGIYPQIQIGDKIIIKNISDKLGWFTDRSGNDYFMVVVIYNGVECRLVNIFINDCFILDDPDINEAI